MRRSLIGRKVSITGPFGSEFVGTVLDENWQEALELEEVAWCWVEWRGIRKSGWVEARALTVIP